MKHTNEHSVVLARIEPTSAVICVCNDCKQVFISVEDFVSAVGK
jgi:hypothetical protein